MIPSSALSLNSNCKGISQNVADLGKWTSVFQFQICVLLSYSIYYFGDSAGCVGDIKCDHIVRVVFTLLLISVLVLSDHNRMVFNHPLL